MAEGKEEEEFTTIRIPRTLVTQLSALLIHPRQPLYEIITKLLEDKPVE